MVRFADDLVVVFTNEKDARRVLDVLPKRLGKYGLTLHPTKTRLLYFRPPSAGGDQTRDTGKQSFDFLGFTHHWARSRRGIWVVMRKTAGSRLSRALKRASEWLRSVRHQPLAQQHEQLVRKLRGHNNYYGMPGNSKALSRFRYEVGRLWRKWLDRRSDKACMTWERFNRLLRRYPLPSPVIRHGLARHAAIRDLTSRMPQRARPDLWETWAGDRQVHPASPPFSESAVPLSGCRVWWS